MKYVSLAILLGMNVAVSAVAEGDHSHNIQEACKAECPKAQSEDEVSKCMEGVVKKKSSDKKFKKTECFAAFQEHEHGKDGHKH